MDSANFVLACGARIVLAAFRNRIYLELALAPPVEPVEWLVGALNQPARESDAAINVAIPTAAKVTMITQRRRRRDVRRRRGGLEPGPRGRGGWSASLSVVSYVMNRR